jgi:Carboxypeptidase regulatory-like domain
VKIQCRISTIAILFVLGIATFLTLGTPAMSQDVSATVSGIITDPSGAAVAGATITATDTARGTVYTSPSNDTGFYSIPHLPVGQYTLKVEAKGFQTAIHPAFTLVLNQVARVDVQMTVGQVTQTVEVSSEEPLLQTEATQLNTVIDSNTIVNLPLASRNYIQLTLLAPGSVHPDPSTLNTAQRIDSAGRPYINGNREQSNNFLLDGMDNNQVSDNLVGYTPSPDAIQEFNLITQNAPAEFGNFEGGVVSASIKSGTNQIHGDIFEFFRNDALNANSWANGNTTQPNLPGDPVLPKAALRWNQFGGTVGGPIKKDKLFYFADYEGQRFDHPTTTSSWNVFSAAERAGDFGRLCTIGNGAFNGAGVCINPTGGTGVQLKNPNTGNPVPFNNLAAAGFTADPVMTNLFASQYYPQPIGTDITANASQTTGSALNADQGDGKLDWNINQTNRLFFRYSEERQDNPNTNSVAILPLNPGDATIRSGVINWVHFFSPNVTNEFRAGANYIALNTENSLTPSTLGDLGQTLGIPNGNSTGPGLLQFEVAGGTVTGFGGNNVVQLFHDTVFQYEDNLSVTHGKHTLKFGFQYFRQRLNTYYSGNNGTLGFFNFTGIYTGSADADMWLGDAQQNGRGIVGGTWGQRSNVYGVYAQDDWRVTSNLTVNIGLRFQAHTPWGEVHGQQDNFGLFSGTPEFASAKDVPAGITFPGNQPVYTGNSALYNGYYGITDWQPRLGIAWTPEFLHNKTVFRAAFTTSDYLEGTGTNLRLPLNPPFGTEDFTDYSTIAGPPPTKLSDGLTLSPVGDPFANATLRVWGPNVRPAVADEWNATVQQQFNNSTTLQVGYVGQHGTHLMVPTWLLQGDLQPNGTILPSPYLAGNPGLLAEGVSAKGTLSSGSMSYNALQATLQHRESNGLQYQVAYTYSHCLTNSSGYYGSWGGQTTPASPYYQNLFDPRAEWGDCYYDVKHDLTAFAVYQLPLGTGKKFATNAGKLTNALVGGWQVSPIWTWRGGFPLDISASDETGTDSQGGRADCLGSPKYIKKYVSTGSNSVAVQWFDPNQYSNPNAGQFGTCNVTPVRGPGLNSVDLSLQKSFDISESKRIEFRTDFLNLFNHPILTSPNTGCGGGADPITGLGQPCAFGLGQVDGSEGERNIQFALKFYF